VVDPFVSGSGNLRPVLFRKPLAGLFRKLGDNLIGNERLADAAGAKVHGAGAAMFIFPGGVAITIRRRVCHMALEDQMQPVLHRFTNSGHESPEHQNQKSARCETFHWI
jgi:hypothetical protein